MPPLLAIDAPSLLFRAFYALPDSIKGPDGAWLLNWSEVWEDGKEWKVERDVLPGRLVWRAERYALETEPEERVPVAVVEGEVDVAAGEARDVLIKFPR